MAGKVNAIPTGYEGATPYLIINDAARALEFYKRALAMEIMRIPTPKERSGMQSSRSGRRSSCWPTNSQT